MSKEAVQLSLPGFEQAHGRWRAEYPGNQKDEWAFTITSNGERHGYAGCIGWASDDLSSAR